MWKEQEFRSLAVKAEWNCAGGTSHLWNEDRVLVETPNFRSLAVMAERKYGGETTSLEVQAEMTCGNGTSHLWKS